MRGIIQFPLWPVDNLPNGQEGKRPPTEGYCLTDGVINSRERSLRWDLRREATARTGKRRKGREKTTRAMVIRWNPDGDGSSDRGSFRNTEVTVDMQC